VYTAGLSDIDRRVLCQDVPCRLIDLPGDHPLGLLKCVDGGVVPPSGTLELTGELPDTHVLSGAQLSLLLLHPSGQAGPSARAVFVVS
jgi:hypothetical protein